MARRLSTPPPEHALPCSLLLDRHGWRPGVEPPGSCAGPALCQPSRRDRGRLARRRGQGQLRRRLQLRPARLHGRKLHARNILLGCAPADLREGRGASRPLHWCLSDWPCLRGPPCRQRQLGADGQGQPAKRKLAGCSHRAPPPRRPAVATPTCHASLCRRKLWLPVGGSHCWNRCCKRCRRCVTNQTAKHPAGSAAVGHCQLCGSLPCPPLQALAHSWHGWFGGIGHVRALLQSKRARLVKVRRSHERQSCPACRGRGDAWPGRNVHRQKPCCPCRLKTGVQFGWQGREVRAHRWPGGGAAAKPSARGTRCTSSLHVCRLTELPFSMPCRPCCVQAGRPAAVLPGQPGKQLSRHAFAGGQQAQRQRSLEPCRRPGSLGD